MICVPLCNEQPRELTARTCLVGYAHALLYVLSADAESSGAVALKMDGKWMCVKDFPIHCGEGESMHRFKGILSYYEILYCPCPVGEIACKVGYVY